MTEDNATLVIRPLHTTDLDILFNEISRQNGQQWLERQQRSEFYVAVAEMDGIPVARLGMDFVSYAGQGAAYLFSAHVELDYQSRGIGTALFLHMEPIARERGFAALDVQVNRDNPRAQRLYELLGYVVVGPVVGRWSYRDGDRVVEIVEDNWLMRKSIAAGLR